MHQRHHRARYFRHRTKSVQRRHCPNGAIGPILDQYDTHHEVWYSDYLTRRRGNLVDMDQTIHHSKKMYDYVLGAVYRHPSIQGVVPRECQNVLLLELDSNLLHIHHTQNLDCHHTQRPVDYPGIHFEGGVVHHIYSPDYLPDIHSVVLLLVLLRHNYLENYILLG